MEKIIEQLLKEVDPDIAEYMLEENTSNFTSSYPPRFYKNWELLPDPTNTILRWQELRNGKKHE